MRAIAQAVKDAVGGALQDREADWMGDITSDPEAQFPQLGQIIDGYRLERELGRSTHGVSFQARRVTTELVTWQAAMAPDVAVFKALWTPMGLQHADALARFNERLARQTLELQTVCGVLIPSAAEVGVAQFIKWGGAPRQPYVIRSYISGYSLAQRVAFERRGLPLLEVASYIAQIGAALDYAHFHKVWHGACTLENVLITQGGDLTVTDFGIERLLAPLTGHPSSPLRLEFARYLAPERFGNPQRVTAADDMYSMGVVLHVLLCGAYPFDGETTEDIRQAQQLRQRRPLSAFRADVTDEIEAVVARALSPRPQNRFASAGALAKAFTSAVEHATGEKPYIAPRLEGVRSRPLSRPSSGRQMDSLSATPSGPDSAWASALPPSPEAPIDLLDTERLPSPKALIDLLDTERLPTPAGSIEFLDTERLPTLAAQPREAPNQPLAQKVGVAPGAALSAPSARAYSSVMTPSNPTWMRAPQRPRSVLQWLAPALSLDGAISLVVFVGALALNLHLLATTSLYFDEAMSIETARQSPSVLAAYLWGYQNQMILYYALLSVWLHLLSALGITATEFLVRLPSVVFAALATVVVYLFGRRFWNRAAGLTAAALCMLSTLQLYHAQKARAYPLQLLLLSVSWYALFLVISGQDRRRRVWLVYVGAAVLAAYAQPYSALVVAAQVATFILYATIPGPWQVSTRAALRSAIVALGAVVALVLPLGADFALHGQPNQFVPIAHLKDLFGLFTRIQLGAPSHHYASYVAAALGALVALGVGASVLWRLERTSAWLRQSKGSTGLRALAASMLAYLPPGAAALVVWLLTPMLLAFVVTQSYLNLHLFYWRYLVVVIPPLCLLVGVGVSAIRSSVLQGVLVVVLVAMMVPETLGYYATAQISDFRTPAAWINAHYHAGDGIACVPGRQCSVPLEYYFTTDSGPAHLTATSPGAWLWVPQTQVRIDPANVEAFSAHQPRVFFVNATFGMSTTQLAQSQKERAWLDSHERLVATCTALTVTVRLYAAGPPLPGQATAPAPHC